MYFDWQTLALQTLNFGILVWLLRRFLYTPVLRMVDARRAEIQRGYDAAEAAAQAAKSELSAIQAERRGISAERDAALQAAAAQAESAGRERAARAADDANALLEETRKTLAAERLQVLAEARIAALDLASALVQRLTEEMPIHACADAWLDRIERYLTDLPAGDLTGLIQSASTAPGVTAVTSVLLPEQMQTNWCRRLRKSLGEDAIVGFAVDPGLIAGVELRSPTAVLQFSLHGVLTRLRAELTANVNSD